MHDSLTFTWEDRRRHPRFPCRTHACLAVGGPSGDWHTLLTATVTSLSVSGVGLKVPKRFARGLTVFVCLDGKYSRYVRVTNVRPAESGWVIGCEFAAPLTYGE